MFPPLFLLTTTCQCHCSINGDFCFQLKFMERVLIHSSIKLPTKGPCWLWCKTQLDMCLEVLLPWVGRSNLILWVRELVLHKCDESLGKGSVVHFPFSFSIGRFNPSIAAVSVVVTSNLTQKPSLGAYTTWVNCLISAKGSFLWLKGEGVTPFPHNAPVCFVRNSWWFSHVEAECTMTTTNILYYMM